MVMGLVTIFDDETGKVYQQDVEILPKSVVSMPAPMCDEYEFHFKVAIANKIRMDEMRKSWKEV